MVEQNDNCNRPMQMTFQWWVKRGVDIVVATLGLFVFSPVMVAIAFAIWRKMGTPIFFSQVRPGLHEKPFTLIKFRTMLPTVDRHGVPIPQAERVTRLGWFLRRLSLDELPELWGVLRGDLSIIGPRPLLTEYLPCYTERERLRHSVRPGLTGLAQVNGRNSVAWEQRLELDAQYVEHWSLGLDFHVFVKSLIAVVRSSGVARDPGQEGALHILREGSPHLNSGIENSTTTNLIATAPNSPSLVGPHVHGKGAV